MTIKYSIVLPCYNEEKNLVHLIRECEQSLCKNDIEVILINNGSTDNTNKILDNYDSTQYFNGQWGPFKRASKLGIYNDTLEVRTHWDIKNMSIFIK